MSFFDSEKRRKPNQQKREGFPDESPTNPDTADSARAIAMQLSNRYHRMLEKLLRPGTRRRYYCELGLRGIRVILNEGWRGFWFKFRQWRKEQKGSELGKRAHEKRTINADIEFTAHNIRLDNGTLTKQDVSFSMEAYPWLVSARRILDTVFPGDKRGFRLADLGCLEGGYAVEFARMGFQVLGLEVRESNIAACRYVKAHTNLPNLDFVQDNAWNIAKYGTFDAIFCCGLLYHLDRPYKFLRVLSAVTRRLVIVQTNFSTEEGNDKYNLSPMTENESLKGRWYTEFATDEEFYHRGESRWSSWDNRRSFWPQREYLLQALHDFGFDLVMEQFDSLGPKIAETMLRGFYKTYCRGTFIGIKTGGTSEG
jgi:2-polyprenyl-3-methyl-5-hydroxy-6-metoxy-1,4-benzoquinol methylase